MYWDWWLGGLGLAVVAIGYHLTLRKTFGVSGILERVLFKKETDELSAARSLADDPEAFMAMLLQATEDAQHGIDAGGRGAATGAAPSRDRGDPWDPDGWPGSLAFLVAVFAGGLIAAWQTGSMPAWPQAGIGDAHTALFGSGSGLVVLVLGGLLVGFGTRMAGGCTAGHGLNGCGRLQVPSLVATGVFFSTAVGVSALVAFAS